MTTRIVCVGSRLVASDALGPRVHDVLVGRSLPEGVELADGGLRGLDLLPLVERSARVVFVDATLGLAPDRELVELSPPFDPELSLERLDHAAGLAFLLRALPTVCEGPPTPWRLVGASGAPDDALVTRVAERALALATDGSWG